MRGNGVERKKLDAARRSLRAGRRRARFVARSKRPEGGGVDSSFAGIVARALMCAPSQREGQGRTIERRGERSIEPTRPEVLNTR